MTQEGARDLDNQKKEKQPEPDPIILLLFLLPLADSAITLLKLPVIG
jgi:hypothetical protein